MQSGEQVSVGRLSSVRSLCLVEIRIDKECRREAEPHGSGLSGDQAKRDAIRREASIEQEYAVQGVEKGQYRQRED